MVSRLPFTLLLSDVASTGNGEPGNASLGISVQKQRAWEFKMAEKKTKENARRGTISVNMSFYRLCPQMTSTFLQEQSPISTGINKACNGAWVENRIECQARVLNKSFQLSTTSIDTHKRKCSPAIETWQVGGELAVKIFGWTNRDSHDFISSKLFKYKCEF